MDGLIRAKECREERQRIAKQMKDLLQKAKDEERNLSGEELMQFDRWNEAIESLEREFTTLEKAAKALAETDGLNENRERLTHEARRLGDDTPTPYDEDMAFRGWLLYGTQHFTQRHQDAIDKCGQAREAKATEREFRMPSLGAILTPGIDRSPTGLRELRAMAREVVTTRATAAQTITTTGGGNLVGNDNSFIAQLQEGLIAGGVMRQLATVIQTDTGATLPIPGNASNQKGVLTAINVEVATADSSFSQQTLGADKYGSMVKLPIELIMDSAINIQQWAGVEIGRRLNRIQEEYWATGEASASEPEGIITTGSSGGAAAGSVAQSSATNIQVGDLTSLQHDIDPNYRPGSTWQFHDSVLENLRSQLDSDGRPLWQPSVMAGAPDRLLGSPYAVNQEFPTYAGSTANEQSKLLTYGRHSDYWIRDVSAVSVQVLRERFATAGQIGVLGFVRSDGQYINPHGGSSLSSIKYMTEISS